MIEHVITHQLVCTRCGTCVWARCGSIKDACWCGGREHATLPIDVARKMRHRKPSETLLQECVAAAVLDER